MASMKFERSGLVISVKQINRDYYKDSECLILGKSRRIYEGEFDENSHNNLNPSTLPEPYQTLDLKLRCYQVDCIETDKLIPKNHPLQINVYMIPEHDAADSILRIIGDLQSEFQGNVPSILMIEGFHYELDTLYKHKCFLRVIHDMERLPPIDLVLKCLASYYIAQPQVNPRDLRMIGPHVNRLVQHQKL